MNINNYTLYFCSLPLSYADSMRLMTECIQEIGKVKRADKKTGIIKGKLKISRLYSVNIACIVNPSDNPHVIFGIAKNALLKVQDKRWYRIAKQLQTLLDDKKLNIDIEDHATRITKILRMPNDVRWCIYNNGRVLIKTPPVSTVQNKPQKATDNDDLDWIDRIEEMNALFGD